MKVKRDLYMGRDRKPFFKSELTNVTISMKNKKDRALITLTDYKDDLGHYEIIELNMSQDELYKLLSDIQNLHFTIEQEKAETE